ncbi:MAG TPA: DUF1015 domain-containing protein [Bryobacteraceae bacterium]|nr:DUF1015 domain-containing protein [Bryobacteraceae bacterium]
MASVFPFHAYRYTQSAGKLDDLVTQPYDKISPAMQARYLAQSPYNLVRVILGERFPIDDGASNVYTRAAAYLNDWIQSGILARDADPGFFAYFQEFIVPDTGERLIRKGFIGLGGVVDYSDNIVHRHEQTLSGPKKDRMELLRHTHAHFGQIFMLYSDPRRAIDRLLEVAAEQRPVGEVVDEYGTIHRLWKISDPAHRIEIRHLMSDKKLLIADGHHRYETALAFRNENPDLPGADKVMMTFVNMDSPGLKILATHRLVSGLPDFSLEAFFMKTSPRFARRRFRALDEFKGALAQPAPEKIRIGVVAAKSNDLYLLEAPREAGQLDVKVVHEDLLDQALGITEDAVREENFLRYIRGLDTAVHEVRQGQAQAGFLLEPTTIQQVAGVAFSGGVMPQKSTDFYPKLLSGFTIYKLS